ncbi:hypothetical protein Btru_041552 [Bulinus truncatus]|nr:hypothetical protein Btru_041552 [Bulinus truncatus]
MMFLSVVGCLAVFVAGIQLTQAAATRCSQLVINGSPGQCVDKKLGCPYGTIEFPVFSNYIGCVTLTTSCCITDTSITTSQSTTTSTTTTTPTTPSRGQQPSNCGLGSMDYFDKIFNGVRTGPCDWPYVVSLRTLYSSETDLRLDTTGHVCQGVLIGKNWVLTSAYCALFASGTAADAPSHVLVVASDYDVNILDIDPLTGLPQEQLIKVDQVFLHPNYSYTSQSQFSGFDDFVEPNSNSIALIKLRTTISGKCSNSICLPTVEEAANTCRGHEECVITGWGLTSIEPNQAPESILTRAPVRLMSNDACDLVTQRMNLPKPKGTTCVYPREFFTDGCSGDEGGAVMCYDGIRWVVRGLLPFNFCLNDQVNLFATDVNTYLTWIGATVAANGGY